MKYLSAIQATSHLDKQNERFSLECLQDMVDQTNRQYIPVWYAHDPRIPPLGRVQSADLVHFPDGEVGVHNITEIYEKDDVIPFVDDGRVMPSYPHPEDRIQVSYDTSYDSGEDRADLAQLCESASVELSYAGKKAQEPLSILLLAGAFALGGIATGFLEKMGADAWDMVKPRLVRLLARRKNEGKEHVLGFVFDVREDERTLCLETYLTNPSEEDIEQFMSEGLELLDQMAPEYMLGDPCLVRYVHGFCGGRVHLSFAVRKDAVPVYPVHGSLPKRARDS